LADGNKVSGPFHSIGFNPFFHSAEFVFNTLSADGSMASFSDAVTEVQFFGAGCSSDERCEIIAAGLRRFFPRAKVDVDHDLLACAYATCGDSPGISCIVGTGSNSCFFDGKTVHEKNYGLGYVLGDEGSGSYFGKKLLTHFLYGLMPKEIEEDFFNQYNLNKNSIIEHVYKQPNPNVWLASFARFLTPHRAHPYIQSMIKQGLREFMELYVCHYNDYKKYSVHFVGSVAFHFQDELKSVASAMDIKTGKVIKQPVEELMLYFLAKRKQS
jgi:N-acetylglucosamine kinase-like BadF-type ATPase